MEQALCGEIPVSVLECSEAFELLSDDEKRYAHYLSKAAWAASPIVLEQTSVESPKIFQLFLRLFADIEVSDLKTKAEENGVSTEDWNYLMHYVSNFFGNMGNYLSFGDTKFLPRISQQNFKKVVEARNEKSLVNNFDEIAPKIYSLEANEVSLNIPPKGISTYYSEDIRETDIELVQKFMQQNKISAYNTRLFKTGDSQYELRLASAKKGEPKAFDFQNAKISVVTGDYQEYMEAMVSYLRQAVPYCSNDNQTNMLNCYIKHFEEGNIDDHKNAQRFWIKDTGPVVECNMGFIESYRDPFGVRGEYEAFVSIVDKKASERLVTLVDNAEKFLTMLPWSKDFEKDSFTRPDFTSLCVVTFASSGIPAGINIPNYDDIRQSEGFKNVSLGNVLAASPKSKPVPFLSEEDEELFKNLKGQAFEVQVALHELLGHGSGKLLEEREDGSKNFDAELLHPFSNEKISSWYKPGETYDTVFKTLGSPMEECRAECVGLFLSVVPEILALFGIQAEEDTACDITYVNWLLLIHGGLRALEFYSPEMNKWRQAHMQARHAIMRLLLENNVLSLDQSDDDVLIKFDRSKLLTQGVTSLGNFLHEINILKATADFKGATLLFDRLTGMNDQMLSLREIVIAKKQPRQVFVQANTTLGDSGVPSIRTYDPSAAGMIQSFIERF